MRSGKRTFECFDTEFGSCGQLLIIMDSKRSDHTVSIAPGVELWPWLAGVGWLQEYSNNNIIILKSRLLEQYHYFMTGPLTPTRFYNQNVKWTSM